jgi:hypothetical protein
VKNETIWTGKKGKTVFLTLCCPMGLPGSFCKRLHWEKLSNEFIMIMSRLLCLSLFISFVMNCGAQKSPTLFTLRSPAKSGIQFTNTITENDTINILNQANIYNGGGVGIGDFNKDGLMDIYFAGATKKISPGGHWINITREACLVRNLDVVQTAEAYACMAITIAACFISCWDEKYRSRVIRPETYINQYIDNNWMPFLQTPPFPEYTSGHSVVSMAAAVVLGKMFGTEFSYVDSTESEFGLTPRSFHSFQEAAREAAISRFYGGIHYMPSILNGMKEGEEIGNYFVKKLRTRVNGQWSIVNSE